MLYNGVNVSAKSSTRCTEKIQRLYVLRRQDDTISWWLAAKHRHCCRPVEEAALKQ